MSDQGEDTPDRLIGGVKPSSDLFQKWSRAPYWEPEEGIALAFGLDPARVVRNDAGGYDNPHLRAPDPAPHYAGFARRAVAKGHLEENARPSDFIAWAEKVGLGFHDDWASYRRAGGDLDQSKLERKGPGRRKLRTDAALKYKALFPDRHEAKNLSWQGACDAIAENGGPRVVPKTLKLGLKELGIR